VAQTATSLASVIKDAWTSDRIQKQFEAENAPLGRLDRVKGTMIGTQAQVPIYNNRSGAYTSVGAAGGSLNPALAQQVTQATYTLVYNWFQTELETSALAQASGSGIQAIVGAKDLEVEGAVENTKHQMTRQLVTNGDGIVATCATGGASTTVSLTPAASEGNSLYGYSALARGWLFPNMTVDIGTTADTDSLVTASTISAISLSTTAPSITIGSSISTTSGTNFVYVPNPNSTTAANPELNGLRQMANSSGALGGLNPSTAGQEFWQAASRDTATTVFSLDLALALQRAARQNGADPSSLAVWTSYKQQANFYSLLQNQVQFNGDGNLGAGNVTSPQWNGSSVDAFADILDTDWFQLSLRDLVKITAGGQFDSPRWASDIQGSNQGSDLEAGRHVVRRRGRLAPPGRHAAPQHRCCRDGPAVATDPQSRDSARGTGRP
jgi:hypothetical protein